MNKFAVIVQLALLDEEGRITATLTQADILGRFPTLEQAIDFASSLPEHKNEHQD